MVPYSGYINKKDDMANNDNDNSNAIKAKKSKEQNKKKKIVEE